MNITFETELETDGRWIAEVPELAGVLAYGATEMEAVGKAEALALRVWASALNMVNHVQWTFGLLSPLHEQVSCNQSQTRFGGFA
jgi:hypothetical protein